jgi:hypothetical protein
MSEQAITLNRYGGEGKARKLGRGYLEFKDVGKAVAVVEYGWSPSKTKKTCAKSASLGFNTIFKMTSLNANRRACCGKELCNYIL